MTPVEASNTRPAGRLGLMVHEMYVPDPFNVGASGKSMLAVLLVSVKSFCRYSMDGVSSTTVMLMYAVAEPPEFVPVMVNIVRVRSSVGVPEISPVAGSRARPAGRLGLTPHVTMTPVPVVVGDVGRSLLAVLLVNAKSFVRYSIVGTMSLTWSVNVVELLPPALLAVTV